VSRRPAWIRQTPTLILLAGVAAATPLVAASPFWAGNSVVFATFSLLSLSFGMSYGQAGILSMATGAFASVGAFGSAIVTTRYGLSPFAGLVPALVLPMLMAYPLARIVTRLSPLPLSIATLALGAIVEITIREGGDFTGGYIGLSGIPPIPFAASPLAMHVFAWGCVAAVMFIYCNVLDSAFGRAANTARHDPLRAIADGVNVSRVLAAFFAISAAVAGLGGWLYAHNLSYLAPDSLATVTSMQVLLMAIVGGVRRPLGPVIGACLLLLIVTYLPAAETEGMVYGGALIVILLCAPQGLIGTAWWRGGVRRFVARHSPDTRATHPRRAAAVLTMDTRSGER